MSRSIDSSFYNARKWRKVAKAYAATQHNLCERCLERGKVRPYDIVHHKIHLNESNKDDCMIAYDFNNLMCLCIECHNAIHMNVHSPLRDDVMFDDNGDLIRK